MKFVYDVDFYTNRVGKFEKLGASDKQNLEVTKQIMFTYGTSTPAHPRTK